MANQNFRVKNGLEVGTGVTISGGIVTATTFSGNATSSNYATTAGITTYSSISGISTSVIGGIGNISQLQVSGVSTFQSSVFLGDGDILYFGDGEDLLIWHNSTDSIIRDNGTGDLLIEGGNRIKLTNPTGIETYGVFNQDGAVELYYDNVKKFETTGAGVTVTGTTFTNQLSVSGVSTLSTLQVGIGGTIITTTSSGVGIGTTNPQTKLEIDGILGFTTTTVFGFTYTNIRLGNKTTGNSLTSGQNNFFAGIGAGSSTTNGYNNNFIGRESGYFNINGFSNNFIGNNAGYNNSSGNTNNFIGDSAGYYNTIGYHNIFFGYQSGYSNISGDYNVFVGSESGGSNTIGNDNVAIGIVAGYYNMTGSRNVFLGPYVGSSASASHKVIIGSGGYYSSGGGGSNAYYFDSPDITKNIQFAIGVRTDSNDSKYWLVGNENFNIGIGTTNPTSKLHIIGDVLVGGIITATSLVKSGGTSSQFLKADGSVDSSTYLTSYSETDTLNTVTNRGNSTSNGISVGVITATSIVKSGGTSSQFLKADGSVDSSTYLTSYTETDTLNSVTNRGNSTSNGISVGIITATSVRDSSGNVRAIPQNSQTSAYILAIGDVGKHISITTGGVTVNSGIFSAGDGISIYNNSGSNQTITQGGSVTMYLAGTATTGNRTLAQRGVCTVLCVASNTFAIFGAGLT